MFFLGWIDDVLDKTGEIVGNIFNYIWLMLCQIVYPLISAIFSVFEELANLEWLGDGALGSIISRVTLILVIVMTFYITFEFVKYTVSPDAISDKEKGAMPLFVRIIVAVLVLAFLPTIFNYAYRIQKVVINRNIIGQVIMGTEGEAERSLENLGKDFAGDVFGAFIIVDCEPDDYASSCVNARHKRNQVITNIKNTSILGGGAGIIQWDSKIEFKGLLALIFGVFVVYVVFMYSASVAQRYIQLIFLQVISPIAVMSYIAPKKDGMFQKWIKLFMTTYLDVFLRLLILYFMMYIMNLMSSQLSNSESLSAVGYLFLIVGLVMFLKKIPKLLEGLFPGGGAGSLGLGFSAKERFGALGSVFGAGKKGVAKGAGAIAGISRAGKGLKSEALFNKNKDKSMLRKWAIGINTMARAGYSGYKAGESGKIGDAIKAGQERVHSYESIVAAGGTVLGHDFRSGHYQNITAGMNLTISKDEDQIKQKEVRADLAKRIKSSQDSVEERAKSKIENRSQKIQVTDLSKLGLNLGDLQSKYGIVLKAGDTTSDMYTQFAAAAKLQSDTVVAKTQALETARSEGRNTVVLERELKEAAQKSAELEALKGQALEELANYSITATISGAVAGTPDPELSDRVKAAQNTLKNVKDGLNTQIAALKSQGKTDDDIKLEMSLDDDLFAKITADGDFTVSTREDLDKIQKQFTSYANSLGVEITNIKEQIRITKEKAENIEAKANSEGKQS